MKLLKVASLTATALVSTLGYVAAGNAITISGWNCVGSCGTSGANGVVGLSPFAGSTQYGWVSTNTNLNNDGLNLGNETTGTVITSPDFTANAGDVLQFYFNYITSDGAGFADYAWATLVASGPDIGLFTARTTPGGNTVPGFGMPALTAALTPAATPIIPGGPAWAPLGTSSGTCYNINGCGYTGWIQATYTIATTGTYSLQFGTVNWADAAYQSGLAFDGATIGGVVIGEPPTSVPEPGSLALIGLGLVSLAAFRRRRAS